VLVLFAIVLLAGCGSGSGARRGGAASVPANAPEKSPPGDIPDSQAYVTYAAAGGGFSVKVPEGWARTTRAGATTFTDKLNSVRIQAVSGGAARGLAARRSGRRSTVHRHAGPATRITYVARSAPDPVTGKVTVDAVERYVFVRGARAVVLTLSGPKGADNVDPWRIVTDSLRWTR
jgi:hypothetical protein